MDFLPSDYEAPKTSSSYMKIQDGENRIRILSSPILGWEDWDNRKPIRFRMNQKPEKPIDVLKPIKHFWAMIVWNYTVGKVQILEITQATIRNRIEELSRDKDWGKPFAYDLKIVKSGSDQLTKYAINPTPAREIDPSIKEAFHALPIDLEELFRGGDPFAATSEHRTKAFWESEKPASDTISFKEALMIEDLIKKGISPVDKEWEGQALRAFKISSWTQLPKKHLDLIINKIGEKTKQLAEDEIPF